MQDNDLNIVRLSPSLRTLRRTRGETDESYEARLITDLRDQAQSYLDENCKPKVTYTIKANVEKVSDVGDTIEVIDERLGINLLTHIVSFDYDCILEQSIKSAQKVIA